MSSDLPDDSTTSPIKSKAASARVLWVIATADAPVTSDDVASELGASQTNVTGTLLRLYQSGLVLRRERVGTAHGTPVKYEYTVAPRGEDV
jgi:predicted transcriptional regulator